MIILIRLIGISLAYHIFIGVIIYLKRKEGNQRTVLMRILANYLQIMATTMAYNLQFPDVLTEVFAPMQVIGAGSKTAFSLDCFSGDSQFKLFFPSPAVLKMALIGLMPILLSVFFVLILALFSLVKKVTIKDYKRNVVVASVIILFMLHPTLTDTALSLFQCTEIDSGDYRVSADMSMV